MWVPNSLRKPSMPVGKAAAGEPAADRSGDHDPFFPPFNAADHIMSHGIGFNFSLFAQPH